MSIVKSMDTIAKWAEKEICGSVKLKKPPAMDEPTDELYDYERVTPACFPMYVPNEMQRDEWNTPAIKSPFPSLFVQIQSGEVKGKENKMEVLFWFSTWETGTHGKDILEPAVENGRKWKEWDDAKAKEYFETKYEGWRDAWNWVDLAIHKLRATAHIGGVELVKSDPIKFGPAKEKEDIVDTYPFWFAWIRFSIRETITTRIDGIEDML